MMERYKGYWITGSAVPGPLYTHYWHPFGKILKDGPHGLRGGSRTISRYWIGSIRTCAGWPSFTGWNLAEYSLIIVCPQSDGPLPIPQLPPLRQ